MRTAKRILKKAAAEDKDPFEGLLNYRNSPFEDIGVTSAQLLMRSTNTNDDTNSSTSLFYPSVDRNRVLKTLHQRRRSAESS